MTESLPALILDARRARRGGKPAIVSRQRQRLAEIVSFARSHSPYYREIYRDIPAQLVNASMLPVTDKKKLMARFDDWVTDPAVRIEDVRTLVENPARVGERFLGRYTVATTSGTTGTQGIFLVDDRSLAVTTVMGGRMLGAWVGLSDVIRVVVRGGRLAMVNATGGHFASAVAAARLSRGKSKRVAVLPVAMPLAEMVTTLNRFQPAVIASYASVAALLASEQQEGRLRIDPVLVVLSAEGIPLQEHQRISSAFNAKVRDSYAATECPFLSYRCAEGWLHVNSDWVILEAIDREHQPVRPGQLSHTVLITNLANRVQPVLRYDLGDRVLERPDPCLCGNKLQAIRVEGRTADLLTFSRPNGEQITVVPLALGSLLDSIPGITQFQIVQTNPTSVRIRLSLDPTTDGVIVWRSVHAEFTRFLSQHQLPHVVVERDEEQPKRSAGGKFREVIPLQ